MSPLLHHGVRSEIRAASKTAPRQWRAVWSHEPSVRSRCIIACHSTRRANLGVDVCEQLLDRMGLLERLLSDGVCNQAFEPVTICFESIWDGVSPEKAAI